MLAQWTVIFRYFCLLLLPCILNIFVIVNVYAKAGPPRSSPWSLETGFGYTQYDNMIKTDGNTFIARMGISKEFLTLSMMRMGIELGIQNGNTGKLDISQDQMNLLGGLPVESVIKPLFDLLLTGKFYLLRHYSFFTLIKTGIAVRHWQFSHYAVNDLTKVSPEFQAGIGFDINRLASISLAYQYIVGKNPNFQVQTQDCCSGHVSNIPSQRSILLALSIHLDEGLIR